MNFITASSAIRQQRIFQNAHEIFRDTHPVLDDFLLMAYQALAIDYPKFYKMDRSSQLGFLASEILLRTSVIQSYSPESVAVVLANAHASLDTDIRFYESMKSAASPALFVYTLPNIVAGEISIRNRIKGENAFFVTPAFEPHTMSLYVDTVLEKPQTKACIAGWIDVLHGHYDVFLYLVEKEKRGVCLDHTPEELTTLYQQYYGTVDGRS